MKVMKFGGTSVADQPAIERLIALVRAERQAEAQTEGGDARGPVVVVSALSGVTDRLLGVAALAGSGDVEGARTSLQDLRARHIKVSEVIKDPSLRQPVVDALNREFDELERVVSALAVLQEVSPRWLDALAATGEILSSQIVAAALTSHKLLATYVDARKAVVTDGEHTAAAPMFEETTAALMTHADPPLAAGRIPVLGGFVGATAERRDDDARPRRLGFFGGHRRRVPRRVGDPDLDRRGRHAHRRSAHRQEPAGRAAPVVRGSVGAGVLRREGAASGDHPAGGGAQHSGAHPQLASRHRARHADHRRAAEERIGR